MKIVNRIRLRPSGAVFAVMTLLLLSAAWNTASNLLYIIFAVMSSVLVFSVVWPGVMMQRLGMTREAPERVHREEAFLASVRIENRKWALPVFAARLLPSVAPRTLLGYVLFIPARRAALLGTPMHFSRRGLQRLPHFTVATAFPFGFVEHRCEFQDDIPVLVYPRVSALRASSLEFRTISGDTPQYVRGEGDEFFSLREYVPGDDVRLIAWRASARMGKWIVRDHEPDTSRFIVVALDSRRADVEEYDEALEKAVELVASVAVALLNRQFTVAVVTPDTAVPLGTGRAHITKVLDMLAGLEASPASARDPFDQAASMQAGPGVAYIFVSSDPRRWGQRMTAGGMRVLDPRGAYAVVS